MKTIKVSISDLPTVKAVLGSFNLILQDERIPIEIREEYAEIGRASCRERV
jgi:hypothetical protein